MRKSKQKEVFSDILAYSFPKNYWTGDPRKTSGFEADNLSLSNPVLCVPDCEPSKFIAFKI